MAQNVVRRLIESGVHFTEDSQARAEKLIKDLVKGGEIRRKDAEETVQALVARGKQTTDHILSLVQTEVSKQMSRFTDRMDGVEGRLEEVAQKLGIKARESARSAEAAVAPAKKAVVKKVTAVKKVAAKKVAPAKQAAAKKVAPAKQAAAKKVAPVKKAVKKAVAKKAPAKKAPAKKSTAS